MPDSTFLDSTELVLNMGPQHPSTHGVLRVILKLDGEKVLGTDCVIGYLHRGVEKIAENRTYAQFNPYVDRMDYVAAISNGLGYCLAVEKLLSVEVPPRAQVIRVILTELNRIASHLVWLGTHALDRLAERSEAEGSQLLQEPGNPPLGHERVHALVELLQAVVDRVAEQLLHRVLLEVLGEHRVELRVAQVLQPVRGRARDELPPGHRRGELASERPVERARLGAALSGRRARHHATASGSARRTCASDPIAALRRRPRARLSSVRVAA